jgi:hypothetical protein
MRKLAVVAVLVLLASALVPAAMADEGKPAPRAVQRCVLFELFSNVNSTNCGDDENATARLAQDYARSRLAILEWFQAGDPLASPESAERYLFYGAVNPPKAFIDGRDVTATGNNESQTYSAYRTAFNDAMNTTPSASITAKTALNGLNGTVNATIGFTENTGGITSGLGVYCFIYEDGVRYAGRNNVTFHKYVVRKQVGRVALNSVLYRPNDNVTANFSFQLDKSWNAANTGIVLALQSDLGVTEKTVHQSALFPLGSGEATYGVDMSPAEQSLNIYASRSADVVLTARNNGSATDRIDFSLSGPAASWGSLGKSYATLAPGEQTSVSVTIMVPAGTAPGGYLVRVRGASHTDQTKYDESVININVQEELVYGVLLSPASDSQDANAGDSASFQIRVKNTGTLSDTVDLSVSGDEPSWADLSRALVALPPNGEDTVTLTVSVPSDAQDGRFDFTVKGTSRADSSKGSSSVCAVKVTGASTATYGVDVSPRVYNRGLSPGASATITIGLNNTGTAADTFDLSKTGEASGWAEMTPISIQLESGASGQVAVKIDVPQSASGSYGLTVRATSRGDNTKRSECSMTFNVQVPEEPPKITSLSATPLDATSKDIITVTAAVAGTSISKVELTFIENGATHSPQPMQKSGSTWTAQIGPFKAKTVIKYKVTATSSSGLKNTSVELTFTVKEAPKPVQQTPGFGALGALAAAAAAASVAFATGKRRRAPLP